jgi:hypothetical protein
VVVADFNGDGHPDLAVENYGSNDVSVLLGNGDGTFQAAVSYGAGEGPGGLAVGDFNGDGVLDLVVANHHSYNVSVLLGRGDGTFRPAEHYAVGWTPAGLAVADLDGDRRSDVIAVNHEGANVSVLLGRPPAPHFRLSTNTQAMVGVPYALALTALDASNRPDSGYTGTVRLASSDPKADFPREIFFAGDGAVQSHQVTFHTAGAQTLIVTDEHDPTCYGAVTVRVTAYEASHFRVAAPVQCAAGKSFRVTVTALDKWNNVADDYPGTIHFSVTDENAELPGDYTFVPGDRGVHKFEVTLKTVKEHTLTVTDADRRSLAGGATIRVTPASNPDDRPE